MKNTLKLGVLLLVFLQTINVLFAGLPIKQLENLESITFYERTSGIFIYTFNLNSYELNNRFSNHMNSLYNDFEGWLGEEFYDVFYSDSDGKFNVNGEFISIECTFHNTGGGGGLNIAEIAFNFTNGNSIFGSYIASYQALGSTYVPGSEQFAADCDLSNGSRMGYTTSSNPNKLRITIGFAKKESKLIYTGCSNDGFSVEINGNIYDESNPKGYEIIESDNGCDSVVVIDLKYNPIKSTDVFYKGCKGDNYSIVVNGKLYNETNPSGTEKLISSVGCDSIVNINLKFHDINRDSIVYSGFTGDGFSVIVNGTVYNELNSHGIEKLKNMFGCDSIIKIKLTFVPKKTEDCIIFKPNGITGKDALIINGQGKQKMNFGDDPQMTAMMWNKNDHSGQSTIRSLFQFQLDQIPANAEIISAKLSLYAWGSDDLNGKHDHIFNLYNDCFLKRITENWDEKTVNWFNQPNTTAENQISLSKPSSGDQDYIDLDVTSLVKDMYKYPQSSYGFMLKLKKEAVFRKVNFSSSDHPDPDKWPELEVCYKIIENSVIDNRDNNDNSLDFEIYPNPTNNTFYIELSSFRNDEKELEILDAKMNVIYKTKDILSEINISNYPKGMYILKLKASNIEKLKKLIVN